MDHQLPLIKTSDILLENHALEFQKITEEKRCPVCKGDIYTGKKDYDTFSVIDLINAVYQYREKVFRSDSLLAKAGNLIDKVANPLGYYDAQKRIKEDKKKIAERFGLAQEVMRLPIFHRCLKCKHAWVIHEALALRMKPNSFDFRSDVMTRMFGLNSNNDFCAGIVFLRPAESTFLKPFQSDFFQIAGRLVAFTHIEKAQKLYLDGNTKAALKELLLIEKHQIGEQYGQIEAISSLSASLRQEHLSGIISDEAYRLEYNKLNRRLLSILNELSVQFSG